MKVGNLTLLGESRSSLWTSIVIPELSICFDIGYIHEPAINQEVILVSHGHGDHIGALQQHTSIRRLRKLKQPIYIMPEECIEPFLSLYASFRALNSGLSVDEYAKFNNPIRFKVSSEGLYHKNYVIRPHYVLHNSNPNNCQISIPAYGYIVNEFRKQLKSEYKDINKQEIGHLVKSGVVIQDSIEYPLVAFTGDTIIDSLLLDTNQDFLRAEYLIIECTFLKDFDQNRARVQGHIHELDLIENANLFMNKYIILCHFSPRYSNSEIKQAQTRIQQHFKQSIIYTL